jgi:putative DNA primase/helicase
MTSTDAPDWLGSDKPFETLTLLDASSVPLENVEWLWKNFIAKGKFHLMAGQPAAGKTTAAISLAAAISTGGAMPDGTKAIKGSVIIWSGEDTAADTIVPRLIAAGAELANVKIINGVEDQLGKTRAFDPSRDVPLLRAKMGSIDDALLLIIDPISQAVSGDSHKGNDVRRNLQPLVDLAKDLRIAVLGITHLAKGSDDRSPMERVLGSIAFVALARIVLLAAAKVNECAEDNDSLTQGVITVAKSNLGANGGGFKYYIEERQITGDICATALVWTERLYGSPAEVIKLMAGHEVHAPSAVETAKSFVQDYLANGAVPAFEVTAAARERGISEATLRRALNQLPIVRAREGFGAGSSVVWSLGE